MLINITLNGKKIVGDVSPDMMLIDFLRENGCKSVKRGCDTSNCGLCTVHMNSKPILSCSTPAVRADGCQILTLEGLQSRALEIGKFIADEGVEQCGYCSPGFLMNIMAMEDQWKLEKKTSTTKIEILEFLSGNLCRCTGYMGHMRAISKYLDNKGISVIFAENDLDSGKAEL